MYIYTKLTATVYRRYFVAASNNAAVLLYTTAGGVSCYRVIASLLWLLFTLRVGWYGLIVIQVFCRVFDRKTNV